MKKSADIQHNVEGVAPAVTDDINKGYLPLSTWVDNVANKAYQAMATPAGAAIWVDLTGGGGATEVGSGTDSIQQVGVSADASGDHSVALLLNATASAINTIAIGNGATSSAQGGVAISLNANATFQGAISIGMNSDATNTNAVGIGNAAQALGSQTVSIGSSSKASTLGSVAIGQSALSEGTAYSTAVGFQSKASGAYSSAFGTSMQATASRSIMIGAAATPRVNSVASSLEINFDETTSTVRFAKTASSWFNGSGNFGMGIPVPTAKFHIRGTGATSGTSALLVENSAGTDLLEVKDDGSSILTGALQYLDGNEASGFVLTSDVSGNATWQAAAAGGGATEVGAGADSLQQSGVSAGASGADSISLGALSDADTTNSIAIGKGAQAITGISSIAIGSAAVATGSTSIGLGVQADASGSNSLSFGFNSEASQLNAIAIGQNALANFSYGIAIGLTAKAGGSFDAISIGRLTDSSAQKTISIGLNMRASAVNAIMIGGSASTPRTNSTTKSVEFNFDEANSTVRLAQSSASWINGSGLFGMGIPVPTAKFHIRGTGATSGTTALLIENSAGTDLLEVKDDGTATIDGGVTIDRTGGNANGLTLNGANNSNNNLNFSKSGVPQWYFAPNYAAGQFNQLELKNAAFTNKLTINQTGETVFGTLAPVTNERLRVTGFTTSNTNKALFVTNSGGATLFEVRDGGDVGIGITPSGAKLHVNGAIKTTVTGSTNAVILDGTVAANSNLLFSKSGTPTWYLGTDNLASDEFKFRNAGFTTKITVLQNGDTGIGVTPTAKLEVGGSFRFNGSMSVNGTAGFTGTGAYTNFTITNGIITAAS